MSCDTDCSRRIIMFLMNTYWPFMNITKFMFLHQNNVCFVIKLLCSGILLILWVQTNHEIKRNIRENNLPKNKTTNKLSPLCFGNPFDCTQYLIYFSRRLEMRLVAIPSISTSTMHLPIYDTLITIQSLLLFPYYGVYIVVWDVSNQ